MLSVNFGVTALGDPPAVETLCVLVAGAQLTTLLESIELSRGSHWGFSMLVTTTLLGHKVHLVDV